MSAIDDQYNVDFEGEYIRVRSDGQKTFELAEAVWTSVSSLCLEHNCYKVLGVANTSIPMPTLDGYDHAKLFRHAGITGQHRIAWVEQNGSAYENIHFIESVLVNRGFQIRLFSDEAEAKKWLLQ